MTAPKFPEPNGYIVGLQWFRHKQTAHSLSGDPLKVYTEEQMQAYALSYAEQARQEALEEAANAVRAGLMMEPLTAENIVRALAGKKESQP